MKSILVKKEAEKKEIKYPCLMKSVSGLVVLMYLEKTGTVLVDNDTWCVGETSRSWDMAAFTPLADEDQVILSNGK